MAIRAEELLEEPGRRVVGPGGVTYQLDDIDDRRSYFLAVVNERLIEMKHLRDLAGERSVIGKRSLSVEDKLRELELRVRLHPELFASPSITQAPHPLPTTKKNHSADWTIKSAMTAWVHEALMELRHIESLEGVHHEIRDLLATVTGEVTLLSRAVHAFKLPGAPSSRSLLL